MGHQADVQAARILPAAAGDWAGQAAAKSAPHRTPAGGLLVSGCTELRLAAQAWRRASGQAACSRDL